MDIKKFLKSFIPPSIPVIGPDKESTQEEENWEEEGTEDEWEEDENVWQEEEPADEGWEEEGTEDEWGEEPVETEESWEEEPVEEGWEEEGTEESWEEEPVEEGWEEEGTEESWEEEPVEDEWEEEPVEEGWEEEETEESWEEEPVEDEWGDDLDDHSDEKTWPEDESDNEIEGDISIFDPKDKKIIEKAKSRVEQKYDTTISNPNELLDEMNDYLKQRSDEVYNLLKDQEEKEESVNPAVSESTKDIFSYILFDKGEVNDVNYLIGGAKVLLINLSEENGWTGPEIDFIRFAHEIAASNSVDSVDKDLIHDDVLIVPN